VGDSEGVSPRTNVVISICILVACGAAWLATSTLPRGLTVDPIGPAYFPRFIILSVAALGAALLVTSLRGLRRQAPLTGSEQADSEPREPDAPTIPDAGLHSELVADADELPPISYRRMIAVFGLSIIYVLLMTPLGYFVSTLVYVILLLLLLRVRNAVTISGCALGVPLVLQSLFNKLLGVPLPGGLFDRLVGVLPC
jgi:hypothetical protein